MTKKKTSVVAVEATEVITSYKGFDKNMKCRDYQFEIGKTYTHEGDVEACESGFHACEYPLGVFSYYAPPCSVFCVVEQSGSLSRHDKDSKIASSSISIKASIDLPGLVAAAFEFVTKRCEHVKARHSKGDSSASSATGYSSASSATGDRSASSATGYRSASSATGDSSASSATGDSSASSATGYSSASSATGYSSASSATGYRSASSATGYSSASSATGYSSASSATGYRSASSATGDRSASIATGDSSASSATGNMSASSATGNMSASSATGYMSASLTTGSYSTAEVVKPNSHSVAIGAGFNNKARADEGCAIVLCYRNITGQLINIRASKVGDNGIKPNVWYLLDANGEFVEIAE